MYHYGQDFDETSLELVIAEYVGKRCALRVPGAVGVLPPPLQLQQRPLYNPIYGYNDI